MADKRKSTIRYAATNDNGNLDKWNADCIFATDNNAEYGYGLLMTASGGYFGKMYYGSVQKYPEQHLCDRVAAYYATAKRMVTGSLDNVKMQLGIGMDRASAKWFYCYVGLGEYAVNHDWRDDKTILTLLQM